MAVITVEQLTEEAFRPFGFVLGQPDSEGPNISDEISEVWLGFSSLLGIGATEGKQATYLRITGRPEKYDQIERHVTTAEVFIPLEGRTILMAVPAEAVDEQDRPDMSQCKAFLMDGSKGVLLKKGTWHAVPYLLSEYATYLVLVDDAILDKDDIDKRSIEVIEFDLTIF